jgi:hypothetical protein
MAKRYAIVVTFPTAPASTAQIQLVEEASDPSIAVNRAIKKAMWNLRKATKHRALYELGKVTWSRIEDKPQPNDDTDAHSMALERQYDTTSNPEPDDSPEAFE